MPDSDRELVERLYVDSKIQVGWARLLVNAMQEAGHSLDGHACAVQCMLWNAPRNAPPRLTHEIP